MKKFLNNVTIGTDVEAFLIQDGFIVSAINVIEGTKENPFDIGEGCAVHADNILIEFTIPPVNKHADFINYLNYCKDWFEINYLDYDLYFKSSVLVPDHLLFDPKAREFGCEPDCIIDLFPDRDVYTEDEFDVINQERSKSHMRTSGFHIHIGYDNPDEETNRELVKLFEKYVVERTLKWENDPENRRTMYGQVGSYRHKPYGVECRGLGGALFANETTIATIYQLTMQVINRFNTGERVSAYEFEKTKRYINQTQKSKVKVK